MNHTNRNVGELTMDKDKRKLTEKELKRKDYFEKLNSDMHQKGYIIKNMIINIRQGVVYC